ncbi:hypothetical protein BDN72DRAFT_842940 [Pluteus cervinus]|uniref:Uncharacterized protein n=1 Tax=Pluteus cervinus TaxID=181527 RepID=A0ACD3ARF0_9AGAR|nr:hypothetical protein BDN72DRAFT_842940 [Pluteus cervinus]
MPTALPRTPKHNPHVDQETLQQLDDEITQLEARIISLKQTRNTLIPIARLHPEILQDIFFLVHISSPQYSKGKASLLITWVSHTWRELAHHTSLLWSQIDFIGPMDWIETALTHANQHVLEFHLDCASRRDGSQSSVGQDKGNDALSALCLSNLPRIKVLDIHSASGSAHFREPTKAWTTPAPLLVELQLHAVFLPKNLFSGTCPSLQSLILHTCPVDWEMFPATPRLKKLSIGFPTPLTTVETIVKILQGVTSTLEELTLHSALGSSFHNSHLTHDRLVLEHLKVLCIYMAYPRDIKALLDHLTLPGLVDIRFETRGDATEPIDSVAGALVSTRNAGRWKIHDLDISSPSLPTILRIKEGIRGADNLSPANPAHHTAIEAVLVLYNCRLRNIVEYFSGTMCTVDTLGLGSTLWPLLITLFQEQNDELSAAVGPAQAPDYILNQDELTRGRNMIWFYDLKTFKICNVDGPKELDALYPDELQSLAMWLGWRKKLGVQLERLIMSQVSVPPLAWLHETFEGLVGDFELVDVNATEEIS